MGAQATRLSDVKVKAAKPKEKDYILTDGDGLQMRVRANGPPNEATEPPEIIQIPGFFAF